MRSEFYALMLLLVSTASLAGSSLSTEAYTNVSAIWGVPPGQVGFSPSGSVDGSPCNEVGAGAAACASSYALSLTDTAGQKHEFNAQSNAIAEAAYGALTVHAFTSPVDMPSGFRTFLDAQAIASFDDSLTIYSDVGFGTLFVSWNLGRENLPGPRIIEYSSIVSWKSGVPAPIFARAAVAADFGFLVGSTTSVDINLVLKSVSVSGGLENSPLSGFLFSSESGTVYNIQGGTAIPEPSSIYLLSAGALILVSRHAAKYVLSRLIEHNTPYVCASLHQRTKRAGIS